MKFVSYQLKGRTDLFRVGFLLDEKIFDVQQSYQLLLTSRGENLLEPLDTFLPADPNDFFLKGGEVIEHAQRAFEYILNNLGNENLSIAMDLVNIGKPIPHPRKIINVGQNYADHVVEMNSQLPEHPVLYAIFDNALIGPGNEIQKTRLTKQLDYEAELVIVVGKEASEVNKEDAFDYIAGYTIGNDISARDLQMRTSQWLQGKSLDNSTPIGPCIVTKDEIQNPGHLRIRSFVNGEKRQDSSTSELIYDIPTLFSFITDVMTLQPGDLIFTGSPYGVGAGMNPPQYLNEGDVVTVDIDGIGQLTNKVINSK